MKHQTTRSTTPENVSHFIKYTSTTRKIRLVFSSVNKPSRWQKKTMRSGTGEKNPTVRWESRCCEMQCCFFFFSRINEFENDGRVENEKNKAGENAGTNLLQTTGVQLGLVDDFDSDLDKRENDKSDGEKKMTKRHDCYRTGSTQHKVHNYRIVDASYVACDG